MIFPGAALGQYDGRERDDRALRISQNLVDDASAGDSGKMRCALRAHHDQVGVLRSALVEQLLGRIAKHGSGSHAHLVLQSGWNQRGQFGLDLAEGAAGEMLGALLGWDDMLQDQAGLVAGGQFSRKLRHHTAGLGRANGAQDGGQKSADRRLQPRWDRRC